MKVTNSAAFGQAVRQRRKELGYTQSFLAGFTGLSVSFISDLENGKSTIELERSLMLANTLGLDCFLQPREKA